MRPLNRGLHLSLILSLVGLAAPLRRGEAGEEPWWSRRALAAPALPAPKSPWARTPVDAFVFARLREKGLEPSPEADRRTLIRRLAYDLHGLPPAPEEVDAFLEDRSPGAYERLVDRLLASPRYGECWGRHWLDIVHFGETHGFDKDKLRANAWPYRDYVIRSLNDDKPYARFVEEQLAGDVLHPGEPEGIVATGFIAAGPWDYVGHVELREGTVDKEITRSLDRDDMVMTAMSTFASTTAHCARCHDHKFDPIPQRDYYGLQAVFAGVDRAERPYDEDGETYRRRLALGRELQAVEARQKKVKEAVAQLGSQDLQRLDARLEELRAGLVPLAAAAAASGTSPTNGYHSSIMPSAGAVKWVQVDLGRTLTFDKVRLVPARPADFTDTPGFGFPLRFRVEVGDDPEVKAARVLLDQSGADFPSPGDAPLEIAAAGASGRYVRVTATRLWKRLDDYVFALAELQALSGAENLALGAAVTALDSIEAGLWSRRYLVDGFSSRQRLEPARAPAEEESKRQEFRAEVERLEGERALLVDSLLDPALGREAKEVRARLEDVRRKLAALPPPRLVYAAASLFRNDNNFTAAAGPRPIHLLGRGNVEAPGELIAPGALSFVKGLEHHFELKDPGDEGSRRAALAKWIVDRENPLTWRSITNRVWQYHFGRGLVDTPNDFGRMGSMPTHPELLDWLAAWFRDRGGSLKDLHRLLLTSAAYRQASAQRAGAASVDTGNLLLWRMNRSRLEAEQLRDAVLRVSGKLDTAMGGPSVQHFFFKDDHSPVYDYRRFDIDSVPSCRRSIYRFIVRSVPDPFMECLDCPDASLLMPQRYTTLTAQQALALLNNPFMARQAEHFAERLKESAPEFAGQVALAYRLALGRPPSPEEGSLMGEYTREHGLANFCRLVFNLNEFIFID